MYGPTTITTKGQVTIPEEVRLFLNAQSGDKALFMPVDKKRFVVDIISTKNVVNELFGSLNPTGKIKYVPLSVIRKKIKIGKNGI